MIVLRINNQNIICLVSLGRVERGAMVEWLEQLGYSAESRHKFVSSRLGFAKRQLENSLCQPSSKWVSFSNMGMIRQGKDRMGLCLSSSVPKILSDSNPHCPYGY